LKENEKEHTSIRIAESVIGHLAFGEGTLQIHKGPDRDPRPHHYRQAEITPPFVTGLQRVGSPHPYKTKVIFIHLRIIRRIRP